MPNKIDSPVGIFSRAHSFSGKKAFEFFGKYLK